MLKKVNDYLPTKKFSLIILSVFLLFILIWGASSLVKKNQNGDQKNTTSNKTYTLKELVDRDSDNDDLPDWEEKLWGMDPNKYDTDDDGISDLKEVDQMKLNTNPEFYSAEEITDTETNPQANAEINETDLFAKELFATILSLNESGDLTPENMDTILNSSSEKIMEQKQIKIFTLKEITVGENKKYKQEIDSLYKKYPLKNLAQIIPTITTSIENNDPEILSELTLTKDEIDLIIKNLLTTKTPEDMVFLHLELVNDFQIIKESIESFSLVFTNPILSFAAFSKFEENLNNLSETIDKINI